MSTDQRGDALCGAEGPPPATLGVALLLGWAAIVYGAYLLGYLG